MNLVGSAVRGFRLRGMKRLEAQRAVLEFLDQFISRGASPDVLAFRDRFAMDPAEWERLDALLPSDSPSEVEAYEAMRDIFAEELEAGGGQERSGPDFRDLVSWTERMPDGQTSDPAQWHDWLGSVARATQFPDPDGFKTVLRARVRFLSTDEGGRRTAIHDDYRADIAFGPVGNPPRRRGYHGVVAVFEDVDSVAPGETAVVRAYARNPAYLPLTVGPDTEFQFMEGARVVAEAHGAERLYDRTGRPVADTADAKTRPLDAA